MYAIKVSYGDVDDAREMATVEIFGTYESLDAACEAAKSKFDAIMERIDNDLDIRFCESETYPDDYYVTYGYLNDKLGCVCQEYYYEVSVIYR